jgi:hypothetical protein
MRGAIDGSSDGTAEGKTEGAMEGTADGKTDGVIEGTVDTDGAIEGVFEGVIEGTAETDVVTDKMLDTAAHVSSGSMLSSFFRMVPVDETPLTPTVKTNCGQRQMLISTVVLLMEAISPGAMMIPSAMLSLVVTASGHVPSDTPALATSTAALKELKC